MKVMYTVWRIANTKTDRWKRKSKKSHFPNLGLKNKYVCKFACFET